MTKEDIDRIASEYFDDKESEHEMDEVFDLAKKALEERKEGMWIDSPNGYFTHCSECGLHGAKGIYKHYGWCPKCGSRMIEPQERSGKE